MSNGNTPAPIKIEQAWNSLMKQLAHANLGYAVGANQQRRALHNLMRTH